MADNDRTDKVLESCRMGDREAFTALFETYRERVHSIARVFFKGDDAAAHDITQQVFLKLMDRVLQFENRADFSTWLYRIVTNACLDRYRSTRRWVLFGSSSEAEALIPSPKVPSVEDDYARAEMSRAVQSAIAELKPKFRIAILLKYFDDLSYEEMAEALQVSMGTIASRLNRGHRMLAQKLAYLKTEAGPEV